MARRLWDSPQALTSAACGLPPARMPPPPQDHGQALARLADWPGCRSLTFRKLAVSADWPKFDPDLVRFATRACALARDYQVPLYIEAFEELNRSVLLTVAFRDPDLSQLEIDCLEYFGKEAARKANLRVVWGGDTPSRLLHTWTMQD